MKITVYDPAKPITAPGVYEMTEDQYHADPCAEPSVSASLIKKGIPGGKKGGSPLHMQWAHPKLSPKPPEEEKKKAFDLGSCFHSLILGKGAEIVIIEANDWRTKAAGEARDAAYEAGKQPVLKSQYDKARAMVAAARPQIKRREELALAMHAGHPELVLVWTEETPSGIVWCRCKLDWIPNKGDAFPDWKTTEASASPDDYGRVMFDTGVDLQDAFYRRGIERVLERRAHMIFPVIEVAEPHAMAVHRVDPPSQAMAERKAIWGINAFAMCLKRGFWPGYPIDTAWQSAPPWTEKMWTDREDAGMTDSGFLASLIDATKDMTKGGVGIDAETAADFGLEPSE